MSLPVLAPLDVQKRLLQQQYAAQSTYLAMYSSWLGGIVKDPGLMLVPVDDHLVHRGDGVFEAIKLVDGQIFLLDEHLKRLESSAAQIGLALPHSIDEIKQIIFETIRAAEARYAVLRLYISRGPGYFTTNPYDSIGTQIYLIVTSYTPYMDEKYQRGVKIGKSQIPPKEAWLAQIKTCNYLPNVMMKKESVDRKIDFSIGIDSQGFITEGSTENIVILDKDRRLVRPTLRQILKGTTMIRTFELAKSLVEEGLLTDIIEKDLSETDIKEALEVMMIGTTLDVLPVVEYEGLPVGGAKQGPVAHRLLQLLRQDMIEGPKVTPVSY